MFELIFCECKSKATDINEKNALYCFPDMCKMLNFVNTGDDERCYENGNDFNTSSESTIFQNISFIDYRYIELPISDLLLNNLIGKYICSLVAMEHYVRD